MDLIILYFQSANLIIIFEIPKQMMIFCGFYCYILIRSQQTDDFLSEFEKEKFA